MQQKTKILPREPGLESPADWGPKKEENKKEAILSKNDDFGKLSKFPILFGGSFFGKLIGFIWRSKDHLEDEGPIWTHLEAQGSFGDEGTFQECQKP